MRFAAIVLAAGKSERMGRNKLLLDIGGRPLLDLLLSTLDASGILERIFVVLGHRPEDIRPIAEAHGAQTVLNPDYEEGMTSSFKAGLSHVSAEAAFLVLGDQVGLDPSLLVRMANLMEADGKALIVSPVYGGRRGHPVLFRRELFQDVLSLSRDETLRDLVLRHEADHRLVRGDVWCVTDIDTPEHFEKAKSLLESSRRALF